MKLKLLLMSLLVVVGLTFLPSAQAGDHPAYLHALSDLRYARFLLSRSDRPRAHFAIEEIDLAIGEIRNAAIDDGKPLEDHPPVDNGIDEHGLFRRALETLQRAHNDVDRDEDNGYAKGLRNRAINHIDRAEHAVHRIIDQW